ncbi:MAG: AtpZ/AtpI family protein [Planctomycetes bacterium]|nr:AtpZ/AtpI family protein [Planctomycetota bacterium]
MSTRGDLQKTGLVFVIGSTVIAGTGVGYLIGFLGDRILSTGPWLAIVFTIIGLAAGFLQAYRMGRKFFRE